MISGVSNEAGAVRSRFRNLSLSLSLSLPLPLPLPPSRFFASSLSLSPPLSTLPPFQSLEAQSVPVLPASRPKKTPCGSVDTRITQKDTEPGRLTAGYWLRGHCSQCSGIEPPRESNPCENRTRSRIEPARESNPREHPWETQPVDPTGEGHCGWRTGPSVSVVLHRLGSTNAGAQPASFT